MASSKFIKNNYQIRSISLPWKSHPSTVRIEEAMNKIRTSSSPKPSAVSICNGLGGLAELYECVDEFLNLSLTRKSISLHRTEKWVEEILDQSVRLLDTCGVTRDILSQTKEHMRYLQSALRRRNRESIIENSIAEYRCFRKKINKEARGIIAALRRDDILNHGSQLLNSDQHFTLVIRVLMEVSDTTISTLESLLLFFCVPVFKTKQQSQWQLALSLIRKGAASQEEQRRKTANELESLDAALRDLSTEGEKSRIAKNRLLEVEAWIERTEGCLECIFRSLINSRTSLLNTISQ